MKKLVIMAIAAATLGLSTQTASAAEWLYRQRWHTGYRVVVVPYHYATYQRYAQLRARARQRIVYTFYYY